MVLRRHSKARQPRTGMLARRPNHPGIASDDFKTRELTVLSDVRAVLRVLFNLLGNQAISSPPLLAPVALGAAWGYEATLGLTGATIHPPEVCLPHAPRSLQFESGANQHLPARRPPRRPWPACSPSRTNLQRLGNPTSTKRRVVQVGHHALRRGRQRQKPA
eukprot:1195700-Prorocentrum_minimum.AAC.8